MLRGSRCSTTARAARPSSRPASASLRACRLYRTESAHRARPPSAAATERAYRYQRRRMKRTDCTPSIPPPRCAAERRERGVVVVSGARERAACSNGGATHVSVPRTMSGNPDPASSSVIVGDANTIGSWRPALKNFTVRATSRLSITTFVRRLILKLFCFIPLFLSLSTSLSTHGRHNISHRRGVGSQF